MSEEILPDFARIPGNGKNIYHWFTDGNNFGR
jgi:hypothetical protein